MTVVISSRSSEEVAQDIAAIKDATKKITASKATARAYLIKNGYMTKGGKLTRRYSR